MSHAISVAADKATGRLVESQRFPASHGDRQRHRHSAAIFGGLRKLRAKQNPGLLEDSVEKRRRNHPDTGACGRSGDCRPRVDDGAMQLSMEMGNRERFGFDCTAGDPGPLLRRSIRAGSNAIARFDLPITKRD